MSSYNDKIHDNSTSTSILNPNTSSTIRARARAREKITEISEEGSNLRYLCDYFARSFGRVCPPVVERDIGDWLAQGIIGDTIECAIDEAQLAPRPSWAYVRAIIRRVYINGQTII